MLSIREKTPNEIRADKIKDLLINTSFTFQQIADLVKSSKNTVARINKGETFKNKNLNYPLRNL